MITDIVVELLLGVPVNILLELDIRRLDLIHALGNRHDIEVEQRRDKLRDLFFRQFFSSGTDVGRCDTDRVDISCRSQNLPLAIQDIPPHGVGHTATHMLRSCPLRDLTVPQDRCIKEF